MPTPSRTHDGRYCYESPDNPFVCTPIPNPDITYPIGVGLYTPIVLGTYGDGDCSKELMPEEEIEDRAPCAVQAYKAILPFVNQDEPSRLNMTWEQFIAITMNIEGASIYAIPGATTRLDLQCTYDTDGSDNGHLPGNDTTCANTRNLFEEALLRQLHETCGQDGCTEQEFVDVLKVLQGWYQAANYDGTTNTDELLISLLDSSYTEWIDNAENQMSKAHLTVGCAGFACSWGNPNAKPPPPYYYASHLITRGEKYGVFDGRVYFIIGR
jgi:hypothetical protein